MADRLSKVQSDPSQLLDTISYYDDSEVTWNERPFFTAVEMQRGKQGFHLDLSGLSRSFIHPPMECLFPGTDQSTVTFEHMLTGCGLGTKYRVVLSGHGGDELLGGIPSPLPELSDHLISGNAVRLLRRTLQWSLIDREPILSRLKDTLIFTANLYRSKTSARPSAPVWLSKQSRNALKIETDGSIWPSRQVFGKPSAISNEYVWQSVCAMLPHLTPHHTFHCEYRYPYLDRELVEFLAGVPRAQLLAPGRRRLLMRRALKGVVPELILERRRKAFVAHSPITALRVNEERLRSIFESPLLSEYGWIDRDLFSAALVSALNGNPTCITTLISTINLELWLRRRTDSSSQLPPKEAAVDRTMGRVITVP